MDRLLAPVRVLHVALAMVVAHVAAILVASWGREASGTAAAARRSLRRNSRAAARSTPGDCEPSDGDVGLGLKHRGVSLLNLSVLANIKGLDMARLRRRLLTNAGVGSRQGAREGKGCSAGAGAGKATAPQPWVAERYAEGRQLGMRVQCITRCMWRSAGESAGTCTWHRTNRLEPLSSVLASL